MFVAIYRWKIKPGMELEFRRNWEEGTKLFRDQHGALGSRLHKSEDGMWAAYAQWPSREIYYRKRDLSDVHNSYLQKMRQCVDGETLVETYEVVSDLLQN